MPEKISKPEDEWRRELTPEQFHILRQKGTERAFTGEYAHTKTAGVYRCAGCGQELFASDTKFESGSGWPSFFQPIGPDRVESHEDASHGMRRVEVTCSRCDSHLGHVFPDGPRPTGLRYCINAASLKLDPK
jgi:peptide-methionine (R)-S-oxide reductase